MGKNLAVREFQTTIDGNRTDLFFLENSKGVRAAITNYGARIVAIWMPDKEGELDNIVAGYDCIADYLEKPELYLGAVVGPFANRIDNASFTLNGKEFSLTANEGENQIHGGPEGFHQKVWKAELIQPNRLKLHCEVEDGTDGYPGNLKIEVIYSLDDRDELTVEYSAVSDKDTILNVTNHAYFNLGGEGRKINARDHEVTINADYILQVDGHLLPTGDMLKVDGTPFDFREPKTMSEGLSLEHPQLQHGDGYDHHFVLNKNSEEPYSFAAKVVDSYSGRAMEVRTTEPGMQFFECGFEDELALNVGSAFCLETQHFPDSPNQPHFPSTLLKAGARFYSKTSYRFFNA